MLLWSMARSGFNRWPQMRNCTTFCAQEKWETPRSGHTLHHLWSEQAITVAGTFSYIFNWFFWDWWYEEIMRVWYIFARRLIPHRFRIEHCDEKNQLLPLSVKMVQSPYKLTDPLQRHFGTLIDPTILTKATISAHTLLFDVEAWPHGIG